VVPQNPLAFFLHKLPIAFQIQGVKKVVYGVPHFWANLAGTKPLISFSVGYGATNSRIDHSVAIMFGLAGFENFVH